jgi:hypothetical protein
MKLIQKIVLVLSIGLTLTTLITVFNYRYGGATKTSIFSESLRIAFQDGMLPDHEWITYNGIVYVSSHNIEDILLPEFKGIKFVKATPQQLQKKADEEGNFMYVYFSKAQVLPMPYVEAISLFRVQSGSDRGYLAGGLIGISFHFNGT